MQRLILIRVVTPNTSEAIILTMHTLLYIIKASVHAYFGFNSLMLNPFVGVESSGLVYILAQFK